MAAPAIGPTKGSRSYKFGELLNHPRSAESNVLVTEGILKNNAIMAVVGPSKSFKSFVLNTLAIDLVLQRNMFATYRSDHGRVNKAFVVAKPCKVMMIEQEIGEDDLEDRLLPIYNSLNPDEQAVMRENLITRSLDHDLQLDTDIGRQRLLRVVAENKPDVLILDPLIEFHTSNENDTQGMAKVMRAFDLLRESLAPLAIVFSHHEGHSTANPRQGIDRFRGNTVVGAKIDSALLVTVHNRRALQLRIDFVIRRGKPLDSLYMVLNEDSLRGDFLCWYRDPGKKGKLAKLELEDIGMVQ